MLQVHSPHLDLQEGFCSFTSRGRFFVIVRLLESNGTTKDVSKLTRKYLPPGTLWDIYQYYTGWCTAHGVTGQASYLCVYYATYVSMSPSNFMFCGHQIRGTTSLKLMFYHVQVAVQGMGHLFAIGIRSGPWC